MARRSGFLFAVMTSALAACGPADNNAAATGGEAAANNNSATQNATASPAETTAPAGEYRLDKYHASLVWRADHLGYSFYTGSFSDFDVTMQFDPENPEAMSVTAEIDVASLSIPTPPEGFFDELMGPDWFQADAFPKIAYRSTGVTQTGPDTARVDGEMTFLGQTAPVSLNVTFNGGYEGFHPLDPQGRIGFSAEGSLKRSAFGMTYGLPPEGSNMGVGDEVTFRFDGELLGPPLPEEASETQE